MAGRGVYMRWHIYTTSEITGRQRNLILPKPHCSVIWKDDWLDVISLFSLQLTLLAHIETDTPTDLQSAILSHWKSQSAFSELKEKLSSDLKCGEDGRWFPDKLQDFQIATIFNPSWLRSERADWLEDTGRQQEVKHPQSLENSVSGHRPSEVSNTCSPIISRCAQTCKHLHFLNICVHENESMSDVNELGRMDFTGVYKSIAITKRWKVWRGGTWSNPQCLLCWSLAQKIQRDQSQSGNLNHKDRQRKSLESCTCNFDRKVCMHLRVEARSGDTTHSI